MKSTVYALLILLSISTASRVATSSKAGWGDAESTTVPFDSQNNLIVISATLNAKGPYRFVLDTGASRHVLRSETAHALGLTVTEGAELDSGGRGRVKAGVAEVAEVTVGEFSLPHQSFLVTPFPASYSFDGLLGAEFFNRFVVGVDFTKSLITLIHPVTFRYRGPGVSVPIKLHQKLIPQLKTDVDGITGWFKFDTGYNGSLALFAEFIEQHKLLARYATRKSSSSSQTITGEVGELSEGRVPSLKLADLELRDVPTSFFTERGGSNSVLAGAIGTLILKRFTFIIDYSRRRVIFESQPGSFTNKSP